MQTDRTPYIFQFYKLITRKNDRENDDWCLQVWFQHSMRQLADFGRARRENSAESVWRQLEAPLARCYKCEGARENRLSIEREKRRARRRASRSLLTRDQPDRLRYAAIHVRFAARRGPRDVTGAFRTIRYLRTRRMYARESLITGYYPLQELALPALRFRVSYASERLSSESVLSKRFDWFARLKRITASGFCIALSRALRFRDERETAWRSCEILERDISSLSLPRERSWSLQGTYTRWDWSCNRQLFEPTFFVLSGIKLSKMLKSVKLKWHLNGRSNREATNPDNSTRVLL